MKKNTSLNEHKLEAPFNLPGTLLGGQDFNWKYLNENYYGYDSCSVIRIRPGKDKIYWQTYPVQDDYKLFSERLRLEEDYNLILKEVLPDPYVKRAYTDLPGIRLLGQDFYQAFISYLFSARKNIVSIKTGIERMRTDIGRKISIDGEDHYLFPLPEALLNTDLDVLKKYGLGFRAKYVKEASSRLVSNFPVISGLDFHEARKYLLSFNGVGDKIADCVLVYSLKNDHIMPLDIWGQRILTDLYGLDTKTNYKKMSDWFTGKFGARSAWAGQILFEWIRKNYKTGVKPILK